MEITVLFRRTGVQDFEVALALASGHPTFTAAGQPVTYSVRYDQDELHAYDALIERVGRSTHTQVLLGGEPVDRQRLAHLLACYRARLQAPDRRAYCQGRQVHETGVGAARQLFPCRLIPISEANHCGWFQYGRLTRDGTFLVDKGQLRGAIREAVSGNLMSYCPAYFTAEVDAVVDALPDRIQPQRDNRWTYREGWHNGRFVAVGVEKRAAGAGTVTGDGRDAVGREAAGEAGARPATPGEGDGPPLSPASPSPAARTAPEAKPATAAGPAAAAPGLPGARRAEVAGRTAAPAGAAVIAPVRYRDVGGLAAEVRTIRENLELPLRHPELFAHLGIAPHRGLLLAGPPGTGKTLLAKALATECQAQFLVINGPEIISKWHGESEANLRRVFEEARQAAPSVVLIDEIDAIAPDRAKVTHNHEAVLVSQLLTLMDGLVERGDVVVVATTNRPDGLDVALRRPGRLDLVLYIGLPDPAARAEILRIHTGRMPLHPDVDLAELAQATDGYAGAHLSALCREAGLQCMREVVVAGEGGALTLPEGLLETLRVRQGHFRAALRTVGAGLARAAQPPAPLAGHRGRAHQAHPAPGGRA